MDFKTWLTSFKEEKPDLKLFVEKIEPLFTESGFNATEFERRIGIGLQKAENEINELVKVTSDAENKQN
jgi:hypothetical protein